MARWEARDVETVCRKRLEMLTPGFFDNSQPLEIDGFSRQDEIVPRQIVYPPRGLTAGDWYRRFATRLLDAVDGHRRFPVYRSGHGEFLFCLGRREWPQGSMARVRSAASRLVWGVRYLSTFYTGTPAYGRETYRQWQLPGLRRQVAKYLRYVAENGSLCMYFSDRDTVDHRRQAEYVAWLTDHGVRLHDENYGHVYFIYGICNGPLKYRLFADRRVLVVSSGGKEREDAVRASLRRLGSAEMRWASVSRSHALLDKVSVPAGFDPDICLIGAGIGAARVLFDLQHLECPTIDAGYVIDVLEKPELARERIYCVPDEEWEKTFGLGEPPWTSNFAKSDKPKATG